MKKLKKILVALLLLLIALAVVSQFLPSKFIIERSVEIAAKPDDVFPWVNNLKKWPEWSAWTVAKDATLVNTYDGPEEGAGAVSRWASKKMGNGQMTITASDLKKGISFDLSFDDGNYLSKAVFTFEPAGDGTKVTWTVSGNVGRNPVGRYLSLFMDSMMGKDFEEGLAGLKAKAENK